MINSRTNNLIILFRFILLLLILSLNRLFYSYVSIDLNVLLNVFIATTLFSVVLFIGHIFIDKKNLFYFQGFFDCLLISYLITNSGFFDSPYIIFYSVIIIYSSFFGGFKGGIFSFSLFVIVFSFFNLNIYFRSNKDVLGEFLFRTFEYGFSFFLVMVLTTYLNKIYSDKTKESSFVSEKLKYLENLHKKILEEIEIGIMSLDGKNNILSANKTTLNILGSPESLILGRKIDEIIPLDFSKNVTKYNEKIIGYKLQNLAIDDSESGKLFIFQDVTEKENLKAKLQEQQQLALLGQFSAVIAHEIKNPLGAIKGSFQLLKNSKKFDIRLSNIVEREINRLDLMLNNLLTVTKDRPMSQEDVDLKNLIDEFILYVKNYGIFEDIQILFECSSNINVRVSSYEFKQILWNLVLNSYEADNNTVIKICLQVSDDIIFFKYRDSGPGISESLKKEITRPFFTTKKAGTGLGLFVVKSICEKYHFELNILSVQETGGGFGVDINVKK